jgi:hydroxymethylglutaryl-CoA reductase
MFLTLEEINTALNQLKVDAKPLWGKMSPQHMVEHLKLAVNISNGTQNVEVFTEERMIPIQKRFLLSSRPLPKLFINPAIGENLLPLEFNDIDSAKDALVNEIKKYEDFFNTNPDSTQAHPVFGKLNKHEWDVFHKKHFEHHFAQFGINIS